MTNDVSVWVIGMSFINSLRYLVAPGTEFDYTIAAKIVDNLLEVTN
jgi:hypothetical protein